jgi:hypothetical protein
MEVELDMKGLDKACVCGSDKKAGSCCRKDESCACGSGEKAGGCCFKEEKKAAKV